MATEFQKGLPQKYSREDVYLIPRWENIGVENLYFSQTVPPRVPPACELGAGIHNVRFQARALFELCVGFSVYVLILPLLKAAQMAYIGSVEKQVESEVILEDRT